MISASVACLTIICKYDFVSFINSLMILGMQSLAWHNLVVMRVALNSGQGLFVHFFNRLITLWRLTDISLLTFGNNNNNSLLLNYITVFDICPPHLTQSVCDHVNGD